MTRETLTRLRRIERAKLKTPPRFTISSPSIRADGSPPTPEEIEYAQRKTPPTLGEWVPMFSRDKQD
jgi:hypothetical protein